MVRKWEIAWQHGIVFLNSGVASYTQRWVLVYISLNMVQICNFFATVLTSKLVILTILFTECNNYISLCCLRNCVRHVKECMLAYLYNFFLLSLTSINLLHQGSILRATITKTSQKYRHVPPSLVKISDRKLQSCMLQHV